MAGHLHVVVDDLDHAEHGLDEAMAVMAVGVTGELHSDLQFSDGHRGHSQIVLVVDEIIQGSG